MKKVLAILLAAVMLFAFTACGGPDRQPLVDSFNTAKDSFNELANLVNENSDAIDPEVISMFQEMSALLTQYKETIESKESLTQEQIDNMKGWLDDLPEYCDTTKAEIEAGLAA